MQIAHLSPVRCQYKIRSNNQSIVVLAQLPRFLESIEHDGEKRNPLCFCVEIRKSPVFGPVYQPRGGGKLADPLDRKSRASVSLCKLSRVFCCTLWPHDSSNAARLLKQPSGISYISYVYSAGVGHAWQRLIFKCFPLRTTHRSAVHITQPSFR